jgi:hypothetical protein
LGLDPECLSIGESLVQFWQLKNGSPIDWLLLSHLEIPPPAETTGILAVHNDNDALIPSNARIAAPIKHTSSPKAAGTMGHSRQ